MQERGEKKKYLQEVENRRNGTDGKIREGKKYKERNREKRISSKKRESWNSRKEEIVTRNGNSEGRRETGRENKREKKKYEIE